MKRTAVVILALACVPVLAQVPRPMCEVHPNYCSKERRLLTEQERAKFAQAHQKYLAAQKAMEDAGEEEIDIVNAIVKNHDMSNLPGEIWTDLYADTLRDMSGLSNSCIGYITIDQGVWVVYEPSDYINECVEERGY